MYLGRKFKLIYGPCHWEARLDGTWVRAGAAEALIKRRSTTRLASTAIHGDNIAPHAGTKYTEGQRGLCPLGKKDQLVVYSCEQTAIGRRMSGERSVRYKAKFYNQWSSEFG